MEKASRGQQAHIWLHLCMNLTVKDEKHRICEYVLRVGRDSSNQIEFGEVDVGNKDHRQHYRIDGWKKPLQLYSGKNAMPICMQSPPSHTDMDITI